MMDGKRWRRRFCGFTLVELLVVIAIIGILVGLLFPVLAGARRRSIERKAKNTLQSLVMALEAYKQEFRRYPPDDYPFNDGDEGMRGSKNLYFYLCQSFPIGERRVGPFMEPLESQIQTLGGEKALISPFISLNREILHPYIYRRLKDNSAVGSMNPKP
jgi:prepilin-type N-terminal cleavage/methylation domain-containing protein